MEYSMTTQFLMELIGTLILVLFGDGVCACVTLNKSKGQKAGWVVITIAWGLAVCMGVLVAGPYTGAHLNPAVSHWTCSSRDVSMEFSTLLHRRTNDWRFPWWSARMVFL